MEMSVLIYKALFNHTIEPAYIYVKGMPDSLIIEAGQKVIVRVDKVNDQINNLTVERIENGNSSTN